MGFKKVDLNEIAEITTGFAFKSKEFNTEGKGVRLIRGKNVSTDFVRWGDDTRYWSGDTSNLEDLFLQVDDIVIGMDGSKIGHNYARIKQTDLPALLVQRVARLRSNGKINQKLLYYYINNNDFTRYIMNVKTGTSIPHISAKQILNYEINLPTIRAQENIVSLIEPLVEKIELNKKMINNLDQLSQTLFKQWFIDFEFPNEEGKPYKSSGGEMVESELGEIPKAWEIYNVNEFAKSISNSINKKEKQYAKFLNTSDVLDGEIADVDFLPTKNMPGQAKKLIEQNDILYSEIRPKNKRYAYIQIENADDYVVSTKLMVLRTNEEILSSKLFYIWLTMQSTINELNQIAESRSGTFPQITFSILSKFKLALPPKNLMDALTATVTPLLNEIYELRSENKKLVELRDTLLPKLLSGEIEIPDELEV